MLTRRLRHRIAIEALTTGQDPTTGEMTTAWKTATVNGVSLSSVPAEVLTGPGKERLAAGSIFAEVTLRITLRWFPGLQPDWRIEWGGNYYNITSIELDRTGQREYRLACQNFPLQN